MAAPAEKKQISSLSERAAEISKQAAWISEYLQSHDLPSPSFDLSESQDFLATDKAIQGARLGLIDACRDLLELAVGPKERLQLEIPKSIQFNAAMAVVAHFDIANHVPLTDREDISFEDLSAKVGLGVERLQRVLRCTIAHRIFNEPRIGFVSHSAASRVLLNHGARSWMSHHLEEMLPASAKLVDSFVKYPDVEEHDKTAMSMAFYGDGPKTYWEIVDREPWKVKRFCDGLEYANSSGGPHDFHHMVQAFDWSRFGGGGGAKTITTTTLVDVGGSTGRVSMAIAHVAPNPNLHFIVQDLPEVEPEALTTLSIAPPHLQPRIRFQPHNFFDPQPIHHADVYLYRQILHDWPDAEAISILRALVPALTTTSTLLLWESIFPDPLTPGLPNGVERLIRSADLLMMSKHNSKERTLGMWKDLLARADRRFVIRGVTKVEGSPEAENLIEVGWEEEGGEGGS